MEFQDLSLRERQMLQKWENMLGTGTSTSTSEGLTFGFEESQNLMLGDGDDADAELEPANVGAADDDEDAPPSGQVRTRVSVGSCLHLPAVRLHVPGSSRSACGVVCIHLQCTRTCWGRPDLPADLRLDLPAVRLHVPSRSACGVA